MVTPSGNGTITVTQPDANGKSATTSTPYDYSWLKTIGAVPAALPYTVAPLYGGSNVVNSNNLALPAAKDVTGSITFTLTWVPASGQTLATDPPPTAPVTLIETDEADWGAQANLSGPNTSAANASKSGSLAADGAQDAEQDPAAGVTTYGSSTTYSYSGVSQGRHLIQADGSSGAITLPSITLHANGTMGPSGSPTGLGFYGVSANFNLTLGIDTRAVTISSSLGQTSHKSAIHFDSNNVALPDPDTDVNGETDANTIKPEGGLDSLITYGANPRGSWAASSAYLWNINGGTQYAGSSPPSGTFTLPGDPPYSYEVTYSLADASGKPTHVYLHLTDARDGANATDNYYLTWHDQVENWQNNGAKVETAPKLFGTSDSPQPPNGFVNIKIAPDTVDWSVLAHTGGGVVTTVAAVLAVVQPETSPVVIGFLTAGGYTLSLATPPDPTIYTPQGTLAQFTADVKLQNQISAGNTANVFLPGAQRIDPVLAKHIAGSNNYTAYFNGLLGPIKTFSVQAYRHRFDQNRIGDGYGSQGYYGRASGDIYTSGALAYVFSWQ